MPWGPNNWGWGWVFGLAGTVFWIAVIVGLILLLRGEIPRLRDRFGKPSALRILDERYARGEISRDEFLERRAVLKGEGASQTPQPPQPSSAEPAATTPFEPPQPSSH
jgi:putative membrane protein